MARRSISAAIGMVVLTAGPAFGDETTDAIRKAGAHYRQGSLGKAFTQSEMAATLIARRLAALYAKTFPGAPGGWRAQPIKSSIKGKARAGRGVILRRTYSQAGGQGKMTAELSVVANPAILAVMKGIKGAEAKRTKRAVAPMRGAGNAFVKFNDARRTGDIFVFVAERFYITVRVQKAGSQELLTRMLSSWNFAGLKKAAGMK